MIFMLAWKIASSTWEIGCSSLLTTRLRAQPKNSANTIRATISPEKARAAESTGFCGIKSTKYWYQGLAAVAMAFFWMVRTLAFCAMAALSKTRTGAGLEDIRQRDGDDGGDAAERDGIQKRVPADLAEAAGTPAQLHRADHQRRQDQRDHHHEDQAQEYGADERHDFAEASHEREVFRRQIVVSDQAEDDAQYESQ